MAVLVDEPSAAPPRSRVEADEVDRGPERGDWRQHSDTERAAGREQRELEEAPPREAALVDDLRDQLLLLRVLVHRVVVLELLGDDQPVRGDDERGGDEEAGKAQREAEQLRVSR